MFTFRKSTHLKLYGSSGDVVMVNRMTYGLIRYARACSSYEFFILRARRLSSKLLKQGYLVERLKSSFRKFYGRYGDLIEQYGVTLSRMLNDILTLDLSDFPTDQTSHQFHDLYTELDLHRIMSGFHGAFATGAASQQGTLTLPDTWFRPPIWDLLMLQLLRPNSSNLPCLYSTFHLEYPLVLSRFCLWSNLEVLGSSLGLNFREFVSPFKVAI